MKAQSSVEYIMVIGVLLVIALPLLYYAMNQSTTSIKLNHADETVNVLANAADSVYALGEGSRKYVWITMPGGVEGATISNKLIHIDLDIFGGTSDIHAKTKANLTGNLPSARGTYRMVVEMLSSGEVFITLANFTESCFDDIMNRDETDVDCGGGICVKCEEGKNCIVDSDCISNYCNDSGQCYTLPGIPIVVLLNPENGNVSGSKSINFSYNVTDSDSDIANCSLIINSSFNETDDSIVEGIVQYFNINLENGDYTWSVNCTDTDNNEGASETRSLNVNEVVSYVVDLWPLSVDLPQPVSFNSGLNSSSNTFGHEAGNDGWDWQDDIYSGYSSCVMFNNADVGTDQRIEIYIGDKSCSSSGTGSGAYGVQFNITQEMYNAIQGGAIANFSFSWEFVDHNLGNSDEAWVKARISKGKIYGMDNFESKGAGTGGDWKGGAGWLDDWYDSGRSDITNSGTSKEGKYHLRLRRGTGYVDRALDLSSATNPKISFWAKANDFEPGEKAYFKVSPDDTNWYDIKIWVDGDDDNQYHFYEFNLTDYCDLSSEFWIAFEANMNSDYDYFYVDDILIYEGNIYYLGSDLDSGTYMDLTKEVYWFDNPDDYGPEFVSYDVTSYITEVGGYYFDLGGKVYDWDNNEYGEFYFDNINLVID